MKYLGFVTCLFVSHLACLFGGGDEITVRTAIELQNAINAAASSTTGTTIHVVGTITGHFTVPATQSIITLLGDCGATLSGGGNGTILTLAVNALMNLDNLTLRDGSAPSGGAIVNNGILDIMECIIRNNTATTGFGGAIFNSTTGNLAITKSCLFSNTAETFGGAIYNLNQMVVIHSKLFKNRAITSDGGAIYNGSTTTSGVVQSSLTNNSAGGRGGAIFTTTIPVPFGVQQSTIANNTAVGSGGGIGNVGTITILKCDIFSNQTTTGDGGGIFSLSAISSTSTTTAFTLLDSHVDNNTAVVGNGGGVANERGIALISTTEIDSNSAPAGKGGGLFNSDATTTTLQDVDIECNIARFGGGIANVDTASLTLNDSDVRHNKATGGTNSGGGIFTTSTIHLVITDSKVCENKPNQITGQ